MYFVFEFINNFCKLNRIILLLLLLLLKLITFLVLYKNYLHIAYDYVVYWSCKTSYRFFVCSMVFWTCFLLSSINSLDDIATAHCACCVLTVSLFQCDPLIYSRIYINSYAYSYIYVYFSFLLGVVFDYLECYKKNTV